MRERERLTETTVEVRRSLRVRRSDPTGEGLVRRVRRAIERYDRETTKWKCEVRETTDILRAAENDWYGGDDDDEKVSRERGSYAGFGKLNWAVVGVGSWCRLCAVLLYALFGDV